MSGDRLAQIETAVEITLRRSREPSSVSCADVLDLVEIARAARALHDEGVHGITDDGWSLVAYEDVIALGHALARLDSGDTEGGEA